jgi:hypothetical protein
MDKFVVECIGAGRAAESSAAFQIGQFSSADRTDARLRRRGRPDIDSGDEIGERQSQTVLVGGNAAATGAILAESEIRAAVAPAPPEKDGGLTFSALSTDHRLEYSRSYGKRPAEGATMKEDFTL